MKIGISKALKCLLQVQLQVGRKSIVLAVTASSKQPGGRGWALTKKSKPLFWVIAAAPAAAAAGC